MQYILVVQRRNVRESWNTSSFHTICTWTCFQEKDFNTYNQAKYHVLDVQFIFAHWTKPLQVTYYIWILYKKRLWLQYPKRSKNNRCMAYVLWGCYWVFKSIVPTMSISVLPFNPGGLISLLNFPSTFKSMPKDNLSDINECNPSHASKFITAVSTYNISIFFLNPQPFTNRQ